MKHVLSVLALSVLLVATGVTQTIRTSDSLWFSTNNTTGEPKLTNLSLSTGSFTDLYLWLKVASGSGYDVGGIYIPIFYSQPAESSLQIGGVKGGKWSGNTGGPAALPNDGTYDVPAPFATWKYRSLYDSTYGSLSDTSEMLLALAQSVAPGGGWNGKAPVAKFRLTAGNLKTFSLTTMRHLLSTGARNPVELSNPAGTTLWSPVVVPLFLNISLTVAANTNWNMLSVGLAVSNYSKHTLFPTASSPAFTYTGSYVVKDTLSNGSGYWLKFPSGQDVSYSGTPFILDTLDVAAGWNMIGSISQGIRVSHIASIPGGIITSRFFGYSGTYFTSDSILPGKAYWVKVGADGKLILSSSAGAVPDAIRIVPTSEPPPAPPDAGISGDKGVPASYSLAQNYPNPFNPVTVIRYQLPVRAYVRLGVYDVLGRQVLVAVNGEQDQGYKSVSFDASGLPSGVYYYRIQVSPVADAATEPKSYFVDVKKMVLMR